jgi:cbb3-type cytochrome oxidase maturation protein
MSVLYVLIPLAVLFAAAAVGAFLWAVSRGQLDDLVTPAMRILHDDDDRPSPRRLPKATERGPNSRAVR